MGSVCARCRGEQNRSARNYRAPARAGKGIKPLKLNVHLNVSGGHAIFFDGYERQDCRSAQPSCESFPKCACAGRDTFNHGVSFPRSSNWGRLAQRSDHGINQCANQRRQRLAYSCASPGRASYRYFLALIDGRDSFDPSASGRRGNGCLSYLLWVRCTKALEAIKAADLLLRDGNFPLVIVDLVLNAPEELRKIPQTNWYRLQRLVEVLPTACLVLTRYDMVSSAQLKLVLENFWDIQTFENEDALSRLRIVVKRSQL